MRKFLVLASVISANLLVAQDYSEGSSLLESKRYPEAKAYFKGLIIENWNNFDAHYGVGLSCYFMKQYEESQNFFDNALSIDNVSAPCYYYKANAYYESKNYKEAIINFNYAEETNQRSIERIDEIKSAFYRGLCYLKLKKYESAIAIFGLVLEGKPDYTKAYINRGIAKGYTGNLKDACQDFREAYLNGDESAGEYIVKYCPATREELNISE